MLELLSKFYIGAALQIDQANADKNIAQAKAEERRAMAVASEQEMKAKAQEARAKVIEAEAEVPKAMAEAFRSGNLGIMDYYRMKNIEADTSMRETIAKPLMEYSSALRAVIPPTNAFDVYISLSLTVCTEVSSVIRTAGFMLGLLRSMRAMSLYSPVTGM